jgi:hypothetical protein
MGNRRFLAKRLKTIIMASRFSKNRSCPTGFTLIEALTYIFIFSLLSLVISGLIVTIYKTKSYTFQQAEAIAQARKGIDVMCKEIREAKSGEDGSYLIEEAEDYQFVFYSDIDKDGKTERVRYFLDGSDFKKGVTKATGWPPQYLPENEEIYVLTSYVRNRPPIFKYYDADLNELPSPARLKDTKLMKLTLVVNVNPNRSPQDFVLETVVQLRNINEQAQ